MFEAQMIQPLVRQPLLGEAGAGAAEGGGIAARVDPAGAQFGETGVHVKLGLRIADLTAQLETLMEKDAAAGKPFRAALLRQRLSSDRLPAPGFFQKAAALGRATDDPAAFTASERQANFLSPNIPG